MNVRRITIAILRFLTPIAFGAICVVGFAQTQPDNTKVNQRDRNSAEPTADKQKMNATDQKVTANIRKAIIADKALSTNAHNIKVITQDGVVTLKGPVNSEDERKSLVAKANAVVAGPDKVHDEISVKP